MYELMKLSGQEYVDEYAQRAKGRLTHVLHRDGHAGHDARGAAANGQMSGHGSADDEGEEGDAVGSRSAADNVQN
jgi:hypothetical protein